MERGLGAGIMRVLVRSRLKIDALSEQCLNNVPILRLVRCVMQGHRAVAVMQVRVGTSVEEQRNDGRLDAVLPPNRAVERSVVERAGGVHVHLAIRPQLGTLLLERAPAGDNILHKQV